LTETSHLQRSSI